MEYDNSDEHLINLVRKHSNIYDRRSPAFKDRQRREEAWMTISIQLNTTRVACEQRWNVLRTRYALEKRKCREENRASTWPLFNSMKFLDGFMQPRKSYGGYNFFSKSLSPSCSTWDMESTPPQYLLETKFEKEEEQIQYVSSIQENNLDDTSGDDKNFLSPKGKMEVHAYHKQEPNPDVIITSEHVDLEYAFGRTVALMLKNIRGRKRRRKAQAAVMQLLCTYDSGTDEES